MTFPFPILKSNEKSARMNILQIQILDSGFVSGQHLNRIQES